MDELDELLADARRLPAGRDQVEVLRRAADLADTLGDLDRGFEARMALVQATYVTEQATDGLAAFAWMVARSDEDPERFRAHQHHLGWVHKWMPGYARKHPQVPAERLMSLVDELERRHVAEGSGRRQALAVRLRLQMETGIGDDLEGLLADWRASARTSLTDCPMCEADLEADVMEALGRHDDALLALEPFLRGEVQACAGGPSSVFRLGVSLLAEAGRFDEARDLFAVVHRAADVSGESRDLSDLAGCAVLLARTGDLAAARRTALGLVTGLGRAGNPNDLMWLCAELARALASLPDDEPVELGPVDELPAAPAGGWTIATLRAALASRALELAARFDERNGTGRCSSQIRGVLDREDLPAMSLRGTDRLAAVEAGEHRTGTGAVAGGAIADGAPSRPSPSPAEEAVREAIESTRPIPAPSEGAEVLDAWVREQFESWRAGSTLEALADRLADTDDLLVEAIALSWLLGSDAAVDRERALDLATDDRLPVATRARLAAVSARVAVDVGETERVADLVDRAVAAVEGGDVLPVPALRIVRNVVEAAFAIGDGALVDRALASAMALDLTEVEAEFLLDSVRLLVANTRRRAVDGPEVDELAERAVLAAGDVLDSAPVSIGDGPTSPLVVVAVLDATSTLMELADEPPPTGPLQRAARGVPVQLDTAPLRAQVELVLADVAHRLDGPAAAMVHQRLAVAAVERVGPPGLAGWARRGLALQLQQLGRHDEALVQFAMSVELLRSGADPINAWMVETLRARCLLEAGDPNRAANVAGDVIIEVDDAPGLPDELRATVLEPALDVAIDAEVRAGADLRATRLLERFAELLEASGRPSVAAWSMGAMCASRSGDLDRAEGLFERGEQAVEPGDGPERERDLAVLRARRAEVFWQLDRNVEAIEAASAGEGHARRAGDLQLAALTASIGARAHHDEFTDLADAGDPGAGTRGAIAVDVLVATIQDLQVLELEDLAAHLGERLDDLRRRLDELGT